MAEFTSQYGIGDDVTPTVHGRDAGLMYDSYRVVTVTFQPDEVVYGVRATERGALDKRLKQAIDSWLKPCKPIEKERTMNGLTDTEEAAMAYTLLGIIQKCAPNGHAQALVANMYNDISRENGGDPRIILLNMARTLHDGLEHGNWPWLTYTAEAATQGRAPVIMDTDHNGPVS